MKDPSLWVHTEKKQDGSSYDLTRHVNERAERGFSTYDWCNFNSYLTFVIIGALEKFKTGHGFPVYGDCKTVEDWVGILDEMIEGFKARNDIDEHNKPEGADYEEWLRGLDAKWKRGMELFTTFYGSLWD